MEVAASERPPVCKVLDYGKMPFAKPQKNNKAAKVRTQKLKEIRLRPMTVIFRGREMQYQEEGQRVLNSVLESWPGWARWRGRQRATTRR